MDIIVKDTQGKIIKKFPADITKTLLKQLEEQGVEITTACKIGTCGSCMCQIVSDPAAIDKSFRTEPAFPLDEAEVMTCIGGISKNVTGSEDIILQKFF